MSELCRFNTAVLRDHPLRNRQMAVVAGPRQVGKTFACRSLGDTYAFWFSGWDWENAQNPKRIKFKALVM